MDISHQTFISDGKNIAGRLYLPDGSRQQLPAVVIYHGWRGRRKRYGLLARAIASHGIATLAFDFRGCGYSEGDSSLQTIANGLQDALAGYDFLASRQEVDPARIGILGVSYGAYLAAIVAGERKVASLLLDSPAAYPDEWQELTVGELDREELSAFRDRADLSATKPAQALRGYAGHLLVVHHELDEQMPRRIAEIYQAVATRAASVHLEVIEGLGHSMTTDKEPQFTRTVTEWFAKTL